VSQVRPQPRQPRRPILFHNRQVIQDDCVAVVRLSWFRQGVTWQVEEFPVYATDEATDWLEVVRCFCVQALQQGADVSLIGTWTLEDLGFEDA
jgi:hypothetical protein